MGAVRTHYLDASAIVKLLVDEPGNREVRDYFDRHPNFYTTSLCFAEALGALKAKYFHRSEITEDEYLSITNDLMAHFSYESIGIDEVEIKQRQVFAEVEKLIQKHPKIDVSDAFQIYTVKNGYFSKLTGESKPILITADSELAQAARTEGIEVWDCMNEPPP